MTKLLSGVRVLDLSRMLAGPYGSMLLADMGAEVIKVEEPGGGDPMRAMGPPFLPDGESAYFLAINRNKKSLAIDLASYGGHFFAGEQTQIRDAITRSLAGGYGVACSKGTTVVLRRGGGTQSLSEKVAAFLGGA